MSEKTVQSDARTTVPQQDVAEGLDARRGGGRPSKAPDMRRTERISFGVTKRQKAAFLVRAAEAGLTSNDYARAALCEEGARAGLGAARAPVFELVDALTRIGADLNRLRFIADETGVLPPGLEAVVARLDEKLDKLIVGAGVAADLEQYRARIDAIAAGLDAQNAMSGRARGMIARIDAVIAKVLSA